MIDERIVEWVKAEKAQGYSEEYLKQYLLQQGHTPKLVDEAINLSKENSSLNFSQSLSQKGPAFMILFYILLVIFSLQLIAGIVISLFQSNFLNLVFPLIFGGFIINYILKKKLYEILMIIFILSPFGLLILTAYPLFQSFIAAENNLIYVLISIHTLIVGTLIAFMFDKIIKTFKKYLTTGIIFSSILGLIFAINNMIGLLISKLSAHLSQLSAENPAGVSEFASIFNSEIFNANIAFTLALIFFNVPYTIFYFKREDKNSKLFLIYLIPIVLFILLSFVLKYLLIFF